MVNKDYQNIPIVWHYLRDPTFSRFYTIPECDRHTLRQTDGQIHDDGMYCVSIASRGKNRPYCTRPTDINTIKECQEYISVSLPSSLIEKRTEKFLAKMSKY